MALHEDRSTGASIFAPQSQMLKGYVGKSLQGSLSLVFPPLGFGSTGFGEWRSTCVLASEWASFWEFPCRMRRLAKPESALPERASLCRRASPTRCQGGFEHEHIEPAGKEQSQCRRLGDLRMLVSAKASRSRSPKPQSRRQRDRYAAPVHHYVSLSDAEQ